MASVPGPFLPRHRHGAVIRQALAWAIALLALPAFAQSGASTDFAPTATLSAAQDANDGVFDAVSREVTVVHGSSRSAALVGGAIQTGDRILTGPRSSAALTLRDGTRLAIGPGTRLELTQFLYDPKSRGGNLLLTLVRGTVRVITGSIARTQPDQFKLVTPTAVIASRDADFIAEQAP